MYIDEEPGTVSKYRFYDETGANVVWVDPDDESKDNEVAITAELVRRYNAFPAMLEALKELVDDVKRKPNDTRYATAIKCNGY